MYDTILIPVDLSATNEAVFDTVRDLGDPDRTHIILLHVIETLQDDEPGEMDDFYEELREEADEKMTAWAAEIAEDGFEVEATITYGERGPEITRVADEEGVDLIVQRSHTVTRDDETNVGTVSHQVAIFAPCSVLLVRTEEA
jgi:nucleotide-binding universal stress UspA family protein